MKRQLAIGLVLLGTSAVSLAADAVPLRSNMTVGKTWKFDDTQTSDSKNTATMNGQSQEFASKTTQHRAGTVEVLAVADGVPTSVRIVFDKDCSSTGEMNGQSQTTPYPYAGQTITLTRSPDGSVKDDFQGQVDPTMSSELHAAMDRDAVLMPNKPVAVGDEWSANPAVVSRVLQLVGQDTGGMTLKLLGVKQLEGKAVADVKVSFIVDKGMGPLHAKLIVQGIDTIDLATGHVIATDFKGTADVNGKQQAPGENGQPMAIEIQGKGAVTIVGKAPLTDGVAATPTPAPFNPFPGAGPGPATPPTPSPNTPPAPGGGNPLSPSPYLGTFSDGKLKVELRQGTDQFSYVGKITMGGNAYDARAATQQNGIVGSFAAGGTDYNFTAKADGDTLTFVTGSTTYTLKKAAANPLDTPPANPLSR